MKDFMDSEKAMIKNMALTKSHKQIADLMDCEVADVAELIKSIFYKDSGVLTYQDKVDSRNVNRVKKAPIVKEKPAVRVAKGKKKKEVKQKSAREIHAEETARAVANQNAEQKKKRADSREPKFKMKQVDYSKLKLIPVDKKTSIYVDPTKNIRQQVEDFKKSSYKKYFEE